MQKKFSYHYCCNGGQSKDRALPQEESNPQLSSETKTMDNFSKSTS
uniref:Uncharacterized protein n=1 Tax=Rhizophora mucronata TaxID=61149 RepID=A0A2P2LA68_RHIMU